MKIGFFYLYMMRSVYTNSHGIVAAAAVVNGIYIQFGHINLNIVGAWCQTKPWLNFSSSVLGDIFNGHILSHENLLALSPIARTYHWV